MTVMTYREAIDASVGEAMAGDDRVLLWGEDVQLIHRELLTRFGPERVRDTPISEAAFTYAGVGAAMGGLRPIVEVMLVDFLPVAWSAVVNAAAKFPAFSNGTWPVPLVIRARCGGWYSDGGQHEQVLWGSLAGTPGLHVVAPSTPADAAGLMLSAVESDEVVVFLEHKLLAEDFLDYLGGNSRSTVDFGGVVPPAGARGHVPDPLAPVPLGRAALVREGDDIALISVGVGAHQCLRAAEALASEGVSASVLDLRSIAPLDVEAVRTLASRTGRIVVADEDYLRGGLSGEIAATVLDAGIPAQFARVAVETTVPFAPRLEHGALPNPDRILGAARRLLGLGGP
jgi:pyruvate/2-oxoglutarate/acetoin dehydrogenase E1 component